MKLPRRQFLHLAAGAAALSALSRIASGRKPIRRGRCVCSSVLRQAGQLTSSRA